MNISKRYVREAMSSLSFEHFTPVQREVVPEAIRGRDIIASSATGTGKTHAYLIPIFEKLNESLPEIQAVIVSPTRELAKQVHDFATHIASFSDTPLDIGLYTGGRNRDKEIAALGKRQPHIVIGTPGRIHDLALKANHLKIYRSKLLVIDEADMALDSGFIDDIAAIANTMGQQVQMMAFSATIHAQLRSFLRKIMQNPRQIEVDGTAFVRGLDLSYTFTRVATDADRKRKLLELTTTIQPYLAVVFTNTKTETDELTALLVNAGHKAVSLHGGLPPRHRNRIMREIRQLKHTYVMATDVASRGLDIPGISHIVNYRLPKDMVFFPHRVGRSARMGASGDVYTFYSDGDAQAMDAIRTWGISGKGLPKPATRNAARRSPTRKTGRKGR